MLILMQLKFKIKWKVITYKIKDFGEIIQNQGMSIIAFDKDMNNSCFHNKGNFLINKLRMKMWCKRWLKISEQFFIITLGISPGPTQHVEQRKLTTYSTSESEMYGIFRKSKLMHSVPSAAWTQTNELKIEKQSVKTSAINCDSEIFCLQFQCG
jgi:hypothetical protein